MPAPSYRKNQFIGAWSTLKIPMFLFEISALGARFAIARWIVSVMGVIFMTLIIDRLVTREEKAEIYRKHIEGSDLKSAM